MVDWVLEAARELGAEPLVVVAAPATADAFDGVEVAVQEEPLGTGDAVVARASPLDGVDDVLVLSGDTPLLTPRAAARPARDPPPRGAPARPSSPSSRTIRGSYGRVLRDGSGGLRGDRRGGDATPEQLAVREVNSSIYVFEPSGCGRCSTGSRRTMRRVSST